MSDDSEVLARLKTGDAAAIELLMATYADRVFPRDPMNCQDVIALLADYLEMTCTPETLASLEEHLAGCEPCQAYLRTYRRTREVVAASERAALPSAMPPEMKAHLRAFLRAQLLQEES